MLTNIIIFLWNFKKFRFNNFLFCFLFFLRVATPEKKKPAARVRKAAATNSKEQAEKDEPMEDSGSSSDSQENPNKPSEAPESRKRAKTVKEVVAAKKPKSI